MTQLYKKRISPDSRTGRARLVYSEASTGDAIDYINKYFPPSIKEECSLKIDPYKDFKDEITELEEYISEVNDFLEGQTSSTWSGHSLKAKELLKKYEELKRSNNL